jgi:predicted DNA-binding transcriptional regulator AlpA
VAGAPLYQVRRFSSKPMANSNQTTKNRRKLRRFLDLIRRGHMLWRRKQLCEILGISGETLRQMEIEGKAPPFLMVGKSKRYDAADIAQWLANQKGASR